MGFQKQVGPLSISEAAGSVTLSLSISQSLGSGALAGVVVGSASAQAVISAKELIDAALALAESSFPAAAPLISGLQAAIDAEIANA